jgi:hypothetical protein
MMVGGVMNFTPAKSKVYFKVELWHNENKVFDNATSGTSTEGNSVTVTWSILQNKYSSSAYDPTSFSINATTGVITWNGYKSGHPANIIKATVVHKDGDKSVTYYATMPVITASYTNSAYTLKLKKNTGFRYAIYDSDGTHPKYDNSNPFEIVVNRQIDGYTEDVSTKTTSAYKVTYSWSYKGQVYRNRTWTDDVSLTDRKVSDTLATNQKAVKPLDTYDGWCVTNGLECVVLYNSKEVARIHIPVHLYLNRYGLAALNGWDGNSIQINEDEGYILTPQIGAGVKESDNSFTGMIMGKVQSYQKTSAEVGLFGYDKGIRTIFLDAETGKSVFGASGTTDSNGKAIGGQIIIDPSSGSAQIYSNSYLNDKTTGLIIDFSEPYIKFGSGKFKVNSEGELTSTAGTIGGWTINSNSISSKATVNNKTTYTYLYSAAGHEVTVNEVTKYERFNIGNKFIIYSDGSYSAANDKFSVDENGVITATGGTIGGWTLEKNRMYSYGNNYMTSLWASDSNYKIVINDDSHASFSVSNEGYLYATSAQLGAWHIETTDLGKNTQHSMLYSDTYDELNRVYIQTPYSDLDKDWVFSIQQRNSKADTFTDRWYVTRGGEMVLHVQDGVGDKPSTGITLQSDLGNEAEFYRDHLALYTLYTNDGVHEQGDHQFFTELKKGYIWTNHVEDQNSVLTINGAEVELSIVGQLGAGIDGNLWITGDMETQSSTITNPSDRNIKKDIVSLDINSTANFIYSLIPSEYKFINGNRKHHGLIAQEVKESMGEEDWGLFVDKAYDGKAWKLQKKTLDGEIIECDFPQAQYRLRYDELIPDLIATVQSLNNRLKELENRS